MKKFTNGPWQWEVSASGHVRLGTPDRGRLVVMDFARKGMQRAEPRFAVMDDDQPRGRRGGILRSMSELIEEHPEGRLDHPDANLIENAPDIYEALRQMIERFDSDTAKMCDDITDGTTVGAMIQRSVDRREDWVRPHRAALAKARGEA